MVSLYTPPTRTARSLLMHLGDFRVNQVDGGVTPAEFLKLTQTITPPLTLVGVGVGAVYTHYDATVMNASSYDELIIDVQPVVTYKSGAPQVSTSNSMEIYNQIAMSARPFWITVLPAGYNVPQLYATRNVALATALLVMQTIYGDMVNLQMLANFRGFAIVQPDLNIMFTDTTVIDRLFQGTLIQQCWTFNVSACVVTARPNDSLALVGPAILPLPATPNPIVNPNSGSIMDHPILGCNPAQLDKLVICYPNDQVVPINGSVVLGQLAAILAPTNRDPGYTPNVDIAYVIPVDDSFWSADGTGGVTAISAGGLANITAVLNFAAAMGITSLGIRNVVGSVNVPAPMQFMPPTANINTTGSVVVWAASGIINVACAAPVVSGAAPTSTVRQFNPSLTEITVAGTTLV